MFLQRPEGRTLTITETLGVRVREVREDRGYSLRQLADRVAELGHTFDASALMRLERGDRRASVDDLIALSLALDVSPDSLLVPIDDELTMVDVPGLGPRTASDVRDWLTGRLLMYRQGRSDDENRAASRRWFAQRPLYEQRALEHDGVRTLMVATHLLVKGVGRSRPMSDSLHRERLEAIRTAVDLLLNEVK